jgi:hypothetical protein
MGFHADKRAVMLHEHQAGCDQRAVDLAEAKHIGHQIEGVENMESENCRATTPTAHDGNAAQ